jgi:hypothetical protein
MHEPINVKSPNNTSKWQMVFNSAIKGLRKAYLEGGGWHNLFEKIRTDSVMHRAALSCKERQNVFESSWKLI